MKWTNEMGSSIQQYCLRWNNHCSNLLLVFEHLFQTEAFTDVTLACDCASIKCHKMVLAACSSYFHQLFMKNTCPHPIVILKDIRESELRAILEYMYKGEVNVTKDELVGLLKVAESLKVKGLVEDNNQRTAASTPNPTPPQQSSSSSPLQQQVQPTSSLTTATASAQHRQDGQQRYYSSSSVRMASSLNTASYGASNRNNINNKSNCLPSSTTFGPNTITSNYILYEESSSGCNTTANTFPAWSNKLSLSPKNDGSKSNTNISANNIISANIRNNNNINFLNSLSVQNDHTYPLKRKRFMTSPPSSSSVTPNKDTPILRTVIRHTSSLRFLNSTEEQQNSINYSFTPTTSSSAPITTDGPTDANVQLLPDRERDRDRDTDRDRDSPMDLFMNDSARNIENMDTDGRQDDNLSFTMDDEKKGLGLHVPSRKPRWKRYRQYPQNAIMAAIDAVRVGMTALQAAREFGVPSRTLYDKVKKLGITTNRPYHGRSFPMSPYQEMNMKDDNSCYNPEELLPVDILSIGIMD